MPNLIQQDFVETLLLNLTSAINDVLSDTNLLPPAYNCPNCNYLCFYQPEPLTSLTFYCPACGHVHSQPPA